SGPDPCTKAIGDGAEIAQETAHFGSVAFADGSQLHTCGQAVEQFRADERFQLADLAADGALGEAEFQTGARKAAKPGGAVEGNQRIEGRHGLTTDRQVISPFSSASFQRFGFTVADPGDRCSRPNTV